VTTDCSSNHNEACELHEPDTSNWLFRSSEYKQWKCGSTRFLWLHGIPGAGKTVLLSHVVEDVKASVKALCRPELVNDTGWGYYYCYYGRQQNETPHMIRWFINQLCRQMNNIPSEVREIYEEGGQPTTHQLIDTLAGAVQNFKRVYFAIDALDESSNRENLLSFLTYICCHTNFGGVQLLAMSRKEIDIERALLCVSKTCHSRTFTLTTY
jgi:hypothetical protein